MDKKSQLHSQSQPYLPRPVLHTPAACSCVILKKIANTHRHCSRKQWRCLLRERFLVQAKDNDYRCFLYVAVTSVESVVAGDTLQALYRIVLHRIPAKRFSHCILFVSRTPLVLEFAENRLERIQRHLSAVTCARFCSTAVKLSCKLK